MSVTDLIADQLTVIRNAIRAKQKSVVIKRSKMLEDMVGIIKREGFIEDFQVIEDNQQGKLKIYFKVFEDGTLAMEDLKRMSTPGRRQYIPVKNIKSVKGGVGFAIMSTDKGLLTDKDAKAQGVGGEVICQIW